jgi:hypothetical protein
MNADSLMTSVDSLVDLARVLHAYHTSGAGMVAVIGVFLIPIVAIVFAMLVGLNASNHRHIERMKMIEAGMMPPQPKPKAGYGLLVWGAILFAFGLALLIAELAKGGGDLEGGLIFGLIGLAMLGIFAYRRHLSAKEATEAGSQPVAPYRSNPPERSDTHRNEPPVS